MIFYLLTFSSLNSNLYFKSFTILDNWKFDIRGSVFSRIGIHKTSREIVTITIRLRVPYLEREQDILSYSLAIKAPLCFVNTLPGVWNVVFYSLVSRRFTMALKNPPKLKLFCEFFQCQGKLTE